MFLLLASKEPKVQKLLCDMVVGSVMVLWFTAQHHILIGQLSLVKPIKRDWLASLPADQQPELSPGGSAVYCTAF